MLEHLAGMSDLERRTLKFDFQRTVELLGADWVAKHYKPMIELAAEANQLRYERDLLALNCSLHDIPIAIVMGEGDREVRRVMIRADWAASDSQIIEPRKMEELKGN